MLDGTFEIESAGRESVRLRRGEGVIYRSVAPHGIRNVSKRIGRLLGVGLRHPPRPSDG